MGGRDGGGYMGHQASAGFGNDGRKRAFDEQINSFFGNLKNSRIDTTSYSQVGRTLMPMHAPISVHTGGGISAEYMAQAPHTLGMGGGGGSHGPYAQHYSLPMPTGSNVRTKEDLQQVDQLLAQMATTVYEHGNHNSSPTTQYVPVDVRNNHSPTFPPRPTINPYAAPAGQPQQVDSPLSAPSHSTGTPAVTPPSSAMSYTSGHSPTVSSAALSPSSRHSSTSVSYPSLPSRPALPFPSSSGLGSNFTHNERRLSGGVLQSASAARASNRTPTPKMPEPATSVSSPSGESEAGEPESYDEFVQHMRTIEYLRKVIKQRLDNHEYEEDRSPGSSPRIDPSLSDNSRIDPSFFSRPGPPQSPNRDGTPLYPVLPRIG